VLLLTRGPGDIWLDYLVNRIVSRHTTSRAGIV
jgi:hypothetical protein